MFKSRKQVDSRGAGPPVSDPIEAAAGALGAELGHVNLAELRGQAREEERIAEERRFPR
jgi:hypothetical protein